MIKKMNLVRPALFAALLCGISAAAALAQDPAASPIPGAPGPLTTPPPAPAPPPPMAARHHGPPPNPLFDALDTNHDGVISAEEIANASASLKALLKNGSDHLTREDLRPSAPPPPAGRGNPPADEAGKPGPKVGAIRPHGPPPRREEDMAAPFEGHQMHRPSPYDEQANEGFDRQRRWREEMREERRPFHREDDEMDNARPYPRHERISRHEGPARLEDDEMDDDARPHHPAPMRENEEARPHRSPRQEDAGMQDDARPHTHEPMNEEAGPRPAHHGPPPMPLFDALDTNHDGTISAEEIANAPAILKGLLKNGSDHLTRDDLRPSGPPQEGR